MNKFLLCNLCYLLFFSYCNFNFTENLNFTKNDFQKFVLLLQINKVHNLKYGKTVMRSRGKKCFFFFSLYSINLLKVSKINSTNTTDREILNF